MFFACLALNDFCLALFLEVLGLLPAPETPCCPNLIVFTVLPSLANTTWLFVGWLGVRFGLLYPLTPSLVILGSFLRIKKIGRQHRNVVSPTPI